MDTLEGLLLPLQNTDAGTPAALVFSLLTAFIVGQMNAWCYKWTHRGLSYTRNFTHALILITIVSSLSMSLIMTNPLAAFGLLGGLAIIRFRTVVRDARDNAFVLLCLICGMSAGLGYVMGAVVGSLAANSVAFYLYRTGFGSWQTMESLLRFQVDTAAFENALFEPVLQRFCRRHSVVSVDEAPSPTGEGPPTYQCVYKVRLRDPERAPDMVSALQASGLIHAVHLLVEQDNEEVA
jgi:hypothetical protein